MQPNQHPKYLSTYYFHGQDLCIVPRNVREDVGNDARFASAAEQNGCVPFTLLETQLLDTPALELSLSRLPEFLASKQGHLAYYYYPYGLSEPERFMPRLGKALADWR